VVSEAGQTAVTRKKEKPANPQLIAAKKRGFVFNGCHLVTAGFCSATGIGFALCFQWLPYGNQSSFAATSPGVTCVSYEPVRQHRSEMEIEVRCPESA
jgi:hypothetical protein